MNPNDTNNPNDPNDPNHKLIIQTNTSKGIKKNTKHLIHAASTFFNNNIRNAFTEMVASLNKKRNYNETFGYPNKIDKTEIMDMYTRNGVAAAAVEFLPKHIWANEPIPLAIRSVKEVEETYMVTQTINGNNNNNNQPNQPSNTNNANTGQSNGANPNGANSNSNSNGNPQQSNDNGLSGPNQPAQEMTQTQEMTRTKTVIDYDKRFITRWNEIVRKNKLFNVLYRCDVLLSLSNCVLLIININDGKSLEEPATNLRLNSNNKSTYDITNLIPLASWDFSIERLDLNPNSDNFMKPLFYKIEINGDESSPGVPGIQGLFTKNVKKYSVRVHYSRCVHLVENNLTSETTGTSTLSRNYNDLLDLKKVTGASAEIYWLNGSAGLHLDIKPDAEFSPEQEAGLQLEIEDYSEGLIKYLRTKGVDAKILSVPFNDPKGAVDAIFKCLSFGLRIPMSFFFGSMTSGEATKLDRSNLASVINAKRKLTCNWVLYQFIERLSSLGVMHEPKILFWKWPDAHDLSPFERAETKAQQARALANTSKSLSNDNPPVTLEEAREVMGFENFSETFGGYTPGGDGSSLANNNMGE